VVFDEHLDITEACVVKIDRKCWQALSPSRLFGWARATAGLIQHLLEKLLYEGLGCLATNAICSRPDERQVESPGQHEASRAGGDMSGSWTLVAEVRRTAQSC
jgi:hypothetical protein